jgi:hypothetical protein
MSQQFNVSPDNLWMAMDYTPTSKTVVNRPTLRRLFAFQQLRSKPLPLTDRSGRHTA